MSLPSRYFWELTQPEIAAQLRRNPLVILPAGSVALHVPLHRTRECGVRNFADAGCEVAMIMEMLRQESEIPTKRHPRLGAVAKNFRRLRPSAA